VSVEALTRDTESVENRIASLVRERLDIIIDDPATDLFATGLLDSLAFVTLLQAIEEEFGITIGLDDLEIEHFRSIDSIVEFVSRVSREGQ
jgi:acyl carrier protein